MKRRKLNFMLIGGAATACSVGAREQQPIPVTGVLGIAPPGVMASTSSRSAARI
jgi:hypothetical protein